MLAVYKAKDITRSEGTWFAYIHEIGWMAERGVALEVKNGKVYDDASGVEITPKEFVELDSYYEYYVKSNH